MTKTIAVAIAASAVHKNIFFSSSAKWKWFRLAQQWITKIRKQKYTKQFYT